MSVARFKAELEKRGLPTYGTKKDFIARLDEVDPTGAWVQQIMNAQEEANANAEVEEDEDQDVEDQQQRNRDLQLEFERRENDLLRRELEIARRENELLRRALPRAEEGPSRRENINAMLELVGFFDGSAGTFRKWEQQIRQLCATYRLDDDRAKLLISNKLKAKAKNWFQAENTIAMSLDEIMNGFRKMYDHRPVRVALRKKFEAREWQTSENFADYFHDKIILAKDVPIDEEEMVDYLIDGIPSDQLQDMARMKEFATKEDMIRVFEKVSLRPTVRINPKRDSRPSGKTDTKPADVQKTSEIREEKSMKTDEDKPRPKKTRCYNCNKFGHLAHDCQQPKRERGSCFICGEMGHILKDCPKKSSPSTDVAAVDEANDENQVYSVSGSTEEEETFFREVDYEISHSENKHKIRLTTLMDTGSKISFIKESLVPKESVESIGELSQSYHGINRSPLRISGHIRLNITLEKETINDFTVLVVPDATMVSAIVLGRDVLKKFGLGLRKIEAQAIDDILNVDISDPRDSISKTLSINPEAPVEVQSRLRKIFESHYVGSERPKYPRVDMELKLNLTDEKAFYFNPRRLSITEKENLRKILDDLLKRKIIQPSKSEYVSPIILVKKKNGEFRLCVDYRVLNKVLRRDNYPLPLIEDQIDVLRDKKYFSILDLKDGFFHIKISAESVKYTAFTTPFGVFEYLRMPFGLKVGPSRFQRFVNEALAELIRIGEIVVYMDDVLVATSTLEHHLEVLGKLFQCLAENLLELRLDKCKFLHTEIEFLGYRISENGVQPNKAGAEAVENYPIPQNVRSLQCFLGMASYFRKFIEGFSLIAKPLHELLRKNVEFKFGEEELKAFVDLKKKLQEAPVLSIYSPHDETELHTDASAHGFGATFMQKKKDLKFHPIFYFSKRTTDTESRYHSFELEMLAVIYALRRFRIYLHGIKFKIVTDCASLKMTLDKKEISPRIERWAIELMEYDYVLEHRAGTRMQHVDALSRATNILVIEDNPLELELAISQNRDPKIQKLREKLENAEDKQFEMRNGLVYKKKNSELRFYVPEKMESHVLRKYHDDLGHFGPEKTLNAIDKTYWFPQMHDKIKEHIRNCLKCIAFSPCVGKAEGFLHPIPKGNVPFATFHVDHVGPIDKRHLIKKHILVVVDGFTKFTKLYATKTTASKESVESLKQHFSNYSRPLTVVTDRGTSFTSGEFEDFLRENNVRHVLVATGSPKANGQVERVNRVLGPLIAKLVDNSAGKYWYKVLAEAEYAINNTIHKSTGDTPSRLLFGVNQRGPSVDGIKEYLEETTVPSQRDLIAIRAKAETKIGKSQEYNQRYFNKSRKESRKYKEGDYIGIKNFDSTPGAPKKLIPEVKGPYEIARILRNDRYVVKDVENSQASRRPYEGTWEAANIRPWHSGITTVSQN